MKKNGKLNIKHLTYFLIILILLVLFSFSNISCDRIFSSQSAEVQPENKKNNYTLPQNSTKPSGLPNYKKPVKRAKDVEKTINDSLKNRMKTIEQ